MTRELDAKGLEAALRECADRLEKACIASGSDAEFAAIAVKKYRDLLDSEALSKQGDGWQPIESAPEGECLLWLPDAGLHFGRVRIYGDGERIVVALGFNGDWKITHWHPLPAPPVSP